MNTDENMHKNVHKNDNIYFVDTYSESLFKHHEELCGDMVDVIRKDDETIVVLADGLGSGVKANILSSMTSRIITTMLAGNADIEECVETISETLPVCSERGIAYSTFTIIRVKHSGEVYTAEFDGPAIVIVRDGVLDEPKKQTRVISGKEIWECSFKAEPDDMIVAFSDGVIHAGVGRLVNLGWKRDNVMEFIQRNYDRHMTARDMTRALIGVCDHLYEGSAGDDTTVSTVRIIPRSVSRIMVGPPLDKERDSYVVSRLMSATGIKAVCGGSTSKLVARELGKPLKVSMEYVDPEIPPTAKIEGIDLVTEGVITIGAVEKILNDYITEDDDNRRHEDCLDLSKRDGATRLARLLIDECSEIVFMLGNSSNKAHEMERKKGSKMLGLDVKVRIVHSIAEQLRKLGKIVSIEEY